MWYWESTPDQPTFKANTLPAGLMYYVSSHNSSFKMNKKMHSHEVLRTCKKNVNMSPVTVMRLTGLTFLVLKRRL